MDMLKHTDCPIMSIVNAVGSLIARESLCGIYMNAGREVGVASTKSFTSQLIALGLYAIWFAQQKHKGQKLRIHYIKDVQKLSLDVEQVLHSCVSIVRVLAEQLVPTKTMLLLGRGSMKFIADEGALKIKEICYIHAEGYAGGSLKHGPFAMLDKDTVVILVAPVDEHFQKMMNAAEEIAARHARILLITTPLIKCKKDLFESIITVPLNTSFQGVLSIIPIQLLAYEIAVRKGYNPDFPRNLAKVVTVDG
jgi:glucosamine--fructose-6-phosphate aminotransferase (isomerizing)